MALLKPQSSTQLKRENSDAHLEVKEEKRLRLQVSGGHGLYATHHVDLFSSLTNTNLWSQDCAETVPAIISNDSEESPTAMVSSEQNETSSGEAPRSHFECLPTELFNNIHKYLTPSAVVAMKFVCRDFNAKSRSLAGTRMVDIRRRIQRQSSSYRVEGEELRMIARIIIDYESRSLVRLSKLTCTRCARARGNTLTGFPDDQFDQKRRDRMCLICVCELHRLSGNARHITRTYVVQGVAMAMCYKCRSLRPANQCVMAASTGHEFCTNCWWRKMFHGDFEEDDDEEEDEGDEEDMGDSDDSDDSDDSGGSDDSDDSDGSDGSEDSAKANGAAGSDGLDG